MVPVVRKSAVAPPPGRSSRVVWMLVLLLAGPLAVWSGPVRTQAPDAPPVSSGHTGVGTRARLTAADASKAASEARAEVSATLAPGLELSLWAAPALVADTFGIDFDATGTAYVSPRRAPTIRSTSGSILIGSPTCTHCAASRICVSSSGV
jgi:hypothetical protein